ncbi:uncharacterized protein LOC122855801 [Aphidius gifuensis]|nr:uncharacterized protein LOC122855801 [Aphidius gifuensis]
MIEIRQKMIERDANEISKLWKLIPMTLYFFCALSSYIASILFYIFWNDIFRGNCPIWGELKPPSPKRLLRDMDATIEDEIPDVPSPDWRRNMIVSFQNQRHCNFYHSVSLCSCMFGIIWLMFFSMCGKGGYDTRIFIAPWRLVPPAILFHLIFTPVVLYAVHDVAYGYSSFTTNLTDVATNYMNKTDVIYSKKCNVVQHYLKAFEDSDHDLCYIYTSLQIFSWIMAWCWFLGLLILLLRIAIVNDFRLLKLTIYKCPVKKIIEEEEKIDENIEEEIISYPRRLQRLLFFMPE